MGRKGVEHGPSSRHGCLGPTRFRRSGARDALAAQRWSMHGPSQGVCLAGNPSFGECESLSGFSATCMADTELISEKREPQTNSVLCVCLCACAQAFRFLAPKPCADLTSSRYFLCKLWLSGEWGEWEIAHTPLTGQRASWVALEAAERSGERRVKRK